MAGLSQIGAQLKSKFSALFSFGGGGAAIGLSIGTSSVKLVELQKSGKIWKLLHFGMIQLAPESVVNREIVNPIPVADSIKTLVNQIKLSNKSVCTSISGASLLIKRMDVECANPSELKAQAFWEAEQYLPFDVSEVVMDFHPISKPKSGKNDVLLVAAKRSVVQSYVDVIADSGLSAKVVDTDYFALQNLFEANYPSNPAEAVAVLEVGASSTKIVVLHSGIPVFTKDAGLGGGNLTADIQRVLGLSYADAEALKTGGQAGGLPQEVSELMNAMSEGIASEARKLIDFYNASSTGAPISHILLAGGGSKLPELSRIVEEIVGVPTQMMNPFNAITYDPLVFTPDYVASIAPLAAVPLGLALRAGAGG